MTQIVLITFQFRLNKRFDKIWIMSDPLTLTVRILTYSKNALFRARSFDNLLLTALKLPSEAFSKQLSTHFRLALKIVDVVHGRCIIRLRRKQSYFVQVFAFMKDGALEKHFSFA